MNANDMIKLEKMNERYSSVNMTGFKFVTEHTDKDTILKHFKMDLEILSTSDVENKGVYRVIIEDNLIDICSNDNGTPVSYFFMQDSKVKPEDIKENIKELCGEFEVFFEDFGGN